MLRLEGIFRNGEMAERFKAAVLKTVERKLRGFESLSLRQIYTIVESRTSCESYELKNQSSFKLQTEGLN